MFTNAKYSNSTTSQEAAAQIDADMEFPEKCGLILLSLYADPDQVADEVAVSAGLHERFVKPRLTELKDYGLVRQVARKTNVQTDKKAWTQALTEETETTLEECLDLGFDPLISATEIFQHARDQYELMLAQAALDTGLVK